MWYVVQVRAGTEKEIITQCEKKIDHGILKRCFVPYYEAMKKYKGEWHLERKILFPGYVFMITDEVEALYLELKSIIGLTKLIGTGREGTNAKPPWRFRCSEESWRHRPALRS